MSTHEAEQIIDDLNKMVQSIANDHSPLIALSIFSVPYFYALSQFLRDADLSALGEHLFYLRAILLSYGIASDFTVVDAVNSSWPC